MTLVIKEEDVSKAIRKLTLLNSNGKSTAEDGKWHKTGGDRAKHDRATSHIISTYFGCQKMQRKSAQENDQKNSLNERLD